MRSIMAEMNVAPSCSSGWEHLSARDSLAHFRLVMMFFPGITAMAVISTDRDYYHRPRIIAGKYALFTLQRGKIDILLLGGDHRILVGAGAIILPTVRGNPDRDYRYCFFIIGIIQIALATCVKKGVNSRTLKLFRYHIHIFSVLIMAYPLSGHSSSWYLIAIYYSSTGLVTIVTGFCRTLSCRC